MKKKHIIISLAIAIIFALFIGYGIEVFDPSPERTDFCPEGVYNSQDETSCIEAGGEWQESPKLSEPVNGEVRGFCSDSKECYDGFNQARTKHDRIVFIVSVILGLAAIIAGIILQKEVAGTGLTGGGVLLILYGTIRYWQHANNILKFILLGIVLGVLIWISYKKLEKNGKR